MADDWDEFSTLVAAEIQSWSEEVLEKPTPLFADMPPCPFAKKAWLEGNVVVHVTERLEPVIEIKNEMCLTDEITHVVAWTGWEDLSFEDFNSWLDNQNKNHFGIWLMGFHPEAESHPNVPEFEGIVEDDYALLLVQSLGYLVKSSDKLRKTNYYQKFNIDDIKYINHRKEVYHAWNEKINEKAYAKEENYGIKKRLYEEKKGH
jgi:hypothetical protein